MKLLRGDRGCFLSFLASRMRSSRRKSQFEVGWIISPPPSRSRVVLGRASYVACPYIKPSEGAHGWTARNLIRNVLTPSIRLLI
jgi:hypothetical protein